MTDFRRHKNRSDTAANWTSENPILGVGEIGVETDTDQFKIGDGVTAWSSLSYYTGGGGGAVDSVNGLTGVVVLTKTNIGLSNVDNTSDASKPISTATQTALNAKAGSVNGVAAVAGAVTIDAGDIPTTGPSDVQTDLDAKAESVNGVAAVAGAVTIDAGDIGALDDEDAASNVQAELDRLQTEKAETSHTHSSVIPLSAAPIGMVFAVMWDGSANWEDAAGNTITARPSARTDLVMLAIGNTTPPSFAIDGKDVHLAEGA